MESAYNFWQGLDQYAIEESFAPPSLGHLIGTGQDYYPLRTRPKDGNIRQTGDRSISIVLVPRCVMVIDSSWRQ